MTNKLYLRAKDGTYILEEDGKEIDLGDYLELKLLGVLSVEDKDFCGKPVKVVRYFVEIHFSAIHNEDNIINAEFIVCSKFVNIHIGSIWITDLLDKVATFSISKKKVKKYKWYWPKINGKNIVRNRLLG